MIDEETFSERHIKFCDRCQTMQRVIEEINEKIIKSDQEIAFIKYLEDEIDKHSTYDYMYPDGDMEYERERDDRMMNEVERYD